MPLSPSDPPLAYPTESATCFNEIYFNPFNSARKSFVYQLKSAPARFKLGRFKKRIAEHLSLSALVISTHAHPHPHTSAH